MHQVLRNLELVLRTSQWAGGAASSDITSSVIDMAGYEGLLVLCQFTNASTSAVLNIHLEMGASSGAGDMVDIAGSACYASTALTGTACQIDLYRPSKRYVRYIVDRQTTDDAIDGVWAWRYHASTQPVTQSTVYSGTSGALYLHATSSGSAT